MWFLPLFRVAGGFFVKNWEAIAIAAGVLFALWYVQHWGYKRAEAVWKPKYEAAEQARAKAVAANEQVKKDQRELEDKYKASQDEIKHISDIGAVKRENIAKIAGEQTVKAESYRAEMERLRKEMQTAAATPDEAVKAAYQRLLGIAQARPRR